MIPNKIKLKGGHPFPPLLDFDGSTWVSLAKQVDASMNKIITFNLYLESSTHDFGDSIIRFPNSQTDDFNIYFSSFGKIQLYTNNFNSAGGFTMTITPDMLKRQLFFEVGKAQSTFKFLKMNGVLQTNEGGTNGAGGSPAFGGQASIIMQNACLWDVRIYDYDSSAFTGPGTLMHWWKGYPRGETDAAWADLVGDVSGYVQGGNPTPKAREIPGFYSEADWPTGNKLKFNQVAPSLITTDPSLGLELSLVRNVEMDNAVGNAGSTDLSVNSISGNTLTVQNLPNYNGFKKTTTWVAVPTTGAYVASPSLCTSINYDTKEVIVSHPEYFAVGNTIALFNPFLNYNFTGDQTTTPSISPSNLSGWGQQYCGSGPMFKDGSVYKWLFYGVEAAAYKAGQIGYAISFDASSWTIMNGGKVWIAPSRMDCSSLSPTGDVGQIDGSYYCACTFNNKTTSRAEVHILFFDKDVSNLSWTGMLKDNAVSGGVAKIGNEYHILYTDISVGGNPYRNIRAAKASNIHGPYTDYQLNIALGLTAPAGVCWDLVVDSPTIHNVGGKVFGLFGAQGQTYSAGVGMTNRQHCLLDFDLNTQTWSINSKGPVLMNPLQWNTVTGTYLWAIDHDGQGNCLLIDGSSAFMANTYNSSSDTYRASMNKLINFEGAASTGSGSLSTSKKMMMGKSLVTDPSLYANYTFIPFAPNGSYQDVSVYATLTNSWNPSSGAATWITFSNITNNGGVAGWGGFRATAASNSSGNRTATINVISRFNNWAINASQNVIVGDSILVDGTTMGWKSWSGATEAGVTKNVYITSSGAWTASITSDPNGIITGYSTSGSGSGNTGITIDNPVAKAPRYAQITYVCGTASATLDLCISGIISGACAVP